MHIGMGYDVHRLAQGRDLIIVTGGRRRIAVLRRSLPKSPSSFPLTRLPVAFRPHS